MASFGRSERQDAIWVRLESIRGLYDSNQRDDPETAIPAHADVVALQAEYIALIAEYLAIHVANVTFG